MQVKYHKTFTVSIQTLTILLIFIGLYRYPIYFIAGAAAAELYMNHRRNYFAERDAVFRHYIQLHPEDFPPPGNHISATLQNVIIEIFRFRCDYNRFRTQNDISNSINEQFCVYV